MKLYDIPREIEEFERRLEEGGGELTPELEQEWAVFVAAGKDKMESAGFVILRIKDDIESCEKEIKRLTERAAKAERNKDRLRSLTLYALQAWGGKLKTSLISMWTGRTGKQTCVEIKEGTDLKKLAETHPDLVRVKYEANLDAVKALDKAGKSLPDCFIIRHSDPTEYLVVK
jgi:Siphovirus Gp157